MTETSFLQYRLSMVMQMPESSVRDAYIKAIRSRLAAAELKEVPVRLDQLANQIMKTW